MNQFMLIKVNIKMLCLSMHFIERCIPSIVTKEPATLKTRAPRPPNSKEKNQMQSNYMNKNLLQVEHH